MLSPGEFVDFYAQVGAKKSENGAGRLFLSAVLAGFFIGMGAAVASTASFGLDSLSAARVASGLLFPFGLIMVIITGAELFTGNCMITISLLERKATLGGMVRNLVIVYLGNFAGAAMLAAAVAYGGAFSNADLGTYVIQTAVKKCQIAPGRAVVLGVLCNILVCAGVMCSLCGKSLPGRAIGAFVPVSFFVIGGFEHCVANMYYIPAGLMAAHMQGAEGLSLSGMLGNLVPVTIGNIIGGCGFGALIWACHRTSK